MGGFNLYGFVGNDGVNWYDLLGEQRNRVPPANRPDLPSGGPVPPGVPRVPSGIERGSPQHAAGGAVNIAMNLWASDAFDQLTEGLNRCLDIMPRTDPNCYCCHIVIKSNTIGPGRIRYSLHSARIVRESCDSYRTRIPREQLNPRGVLYIDSVWPW